MTREPSNVGRHPSYRKPGWLTRNLLNRAVVALARAGVGLAGARILGVRGRTSGQWRETPVNPLRYDGRRYLVSPRGETQWVRNLRVAGSGRLRVGRRVEMFTAAEVADTTRKVAVLRAYLRAWGWETGQFFGGVKADSPDEDVAREASRHPVFELHE